MKLLLQILWGKQGKWQFLFAVGGFFVGLIIMLLSVQVYVDVDGLVGGNGDDEKSYLIINKQVTLMNTFNKEVSRFSKEELDTLLMQPFIDNVGVFRSNTFSMQADMAQQMGFAFDLFFESIDDQYIDTIPEDFKWEEGQKFIPVMISSDFLRLYNFGVAMTQKKLPQLPKEAIQMYPFNVSVKDKNDSIVTYKARVVGYTDRIPSILVPNKFMDFANRTYGTGNEAMPSRLMLEVEDPGDEALQQYLAENYYDTNKEQMRISSLGKVLKFVVAVAGAIGLLFVVMAFVIFVINFQLIISRAKRDIDILLDIGYTTNTISNILSAQFTVVMILVLGLGVGVVYMLTDSLHQYALGYGIAVNTPFSEWVWIMGAASTVVVLLINRFSLWMSLR